MSGFQADQLIADMGAAQSTVERFSVLTRELGKLGFDQVNYGFLNLQAAERMEAEVSFLSTMSDAWMTHYYDQARHETDVHVIRVRQGNLMPYIWNEASIPQLTKPAEIETAREVVEAGLRCGWFVPLADMFDPFSPAAAVVLGSSMRAEEFKKVTDEHGAALMTAAHLFHNSSIRQLWREQAKVKSLTLRERDCLQFAADGRRHEAIAEVMGIAVVTVELHLSTARKKLRAHTLGEAIARALVFGEIRRG